MTIQVVMPQLGESVDEGTITKWLKSIGNSVEEFEPLLEVNTDKVDTEIPSPAAGVLLEILQPEGATVRAGALLARIGEAGEKTEAKAIEEDQAPTSPGKTPGSMPGAPATAMPTSGLPRQTSETRDLGFISPVVAKIASENKVDLHQVQGTGLGGRITKKDVLDFLAGLAASGTPDASKTPTPEKSSPPLIQQAVSPAIPQASESHLEPLNTVRRAIAEHMVMSKHTSPHVTTVMEVDLSQVVAHRQAHKEQFAQDGVNLTFTAYFVAASVAALKAFPIVNSSWHEKGILFHRAINIGMATSLGDAGLIVPVIKNADSLSLLGMGRLINDLAQRARARQLKPDEVQGGTFTITNHGISGSLFASPIINQPQCAILGVGAIQKRVVVINDASGSDLIAIRPMAYITLTFDHRILDGAIADYFLGKVVQTLANWQ